MSLHSDYYEHDWEDGSFYFIGKYVPFACEAARYEQDETCEFFWSSALHEDGECDTHRPRVMSGDVGVVVGPSRTPPTSSRTSYGS